MNPTLASALFAAVLAGSTQAQDIALDAVHAPAADQTLASGAQFAELRAELTALGFTLHARSVFGAAELNGMDAVFLMQPYVARYTAGEIAALADFAAAGGGVVVLGEGGAASDSIVFNMNALVAPYGCSYAATATEGDGLFVTPLHSHALTHGIDGFGVDFQRRLTLAAPATDLTVLGGAQDALAVVDGYLGGHDVVLLSDSTLFTNGLTADHDLTRPENRRLLRNLAVNATAGHDAFVVPPFSPGIAGQSNRLSAYEALPGKRVYFLGSRATGMTVLPLCGSTLQLAAPMLLGSALADASGTASLSVAVPGILAGTSVFVQAVQLAGCGRSNLLRANF